MAEPSNASETSERREGWRERKQMLTYERLSSAALRLFAEQGYDDTTVEQIAAHAEVSVSTFFRYFSSKEDLLFVAPSRGRPLVFIEEKTFDAALERAFERRGASDLGAVGAAIESLGPEINQLRERLLLLRAAVAQSAVLRGRASDASRQLEEKIGGAIAQHRGMAGPDSACRAVGVMAMAIYRLAIDNWLGQSRASFEDVFKEELRRCQAMMDGLRGP
jgi:AcrR family transcriptional regulator